MEVQFLQYGALGLLGLIIVLLYRFTTKVSDNHLTHISLILSELRDETKGMREDIKGLADDIRRHIDKT